MSTSRFKVGDIIHTRSGKTPWRIESIGISDHWLHEEREVYMCRSLTTGRRKQYWTASSWIEPWDGPLPDTEPTPTVLRGHGLTDEGGPFTDERKRANGSSWRRSGVGRALCSCGELSEVLPSASARKRWHKAHKDAIRADQSRPMRVSRAVEGEHA